LIWRLSKVKSTKPPEVIAPQNVDSDTPQEVASPRVIDDPLETKVYRWTGHIGSDSPSWSELQISEEESILMVDRATTDWEDELLSGALDLLSQQNYDDACRQILAARPELSDKFYLLVQRLSVSTPMAPEVPHSLSLGPDRQRNVFEGLEKVLKEVTKTRCFAERFHEEAHSYGMNLQGVIGIKEWAIRTWQVGGNTQRVTLAWFLEGLSQGTQRHTRDPGESEVVRQVGVLARAYQSADLEAVYQSLA
jgi:hypothetical protein